MAPAGQLYDLENDMGETENLYLAMPEKVEELKREFESLVRDEN